MNTLQEMFNESSVSALKPKVLETYFTIIAGEYDVNNGKILSTYTQRDLQEICKVSPATISNRLKDLERAGVIKSEKQFGKDSVIVLGEIRKNRKLFYFKKELVGNTQSPGNDLEGITSEYFDTSHIKPVRNYNYTVNNLYSDLEKAYGSILGKVKKVGKYQNGIKSLFEFENKDKDRIIKVFTFYLRFYKYYRTVSNYPNFPVFIGFYDVIARDCDLFTDKPNNVVFIERLIEMVTTKFNKQYQDSQNLLELIRNCNNFLESCTLTSEALESIFSFYLDSYLNPDLKFVKGLPNLSKFFRYFTAIYALYTDKNIAVVEEIPEEALHVKTEKELEKERKEKERQAEIDRLAELAELAADPYSEYI